MCSLLVGGFCEAREMPSAVAPAVARCAPGNVSARQVARPALPSPCGSFAPLVGIEIVRSFTGPVEAVVFRACSSAFLIIVAS